MGNSCYLNVILQIFARNKELYGEIQKLNEKIGLECAQNFLSDFEIDFLKISLTLFKKLNEKIEFDEKGESIQFENPSQFTEFLL